MKREIETLLLKLSDGSRVLRFSEQQSGLSLEKRLERQESVARQKQRFVASRRDAKNAQVTRLLPPSHCAQACRGSWEIWNQRQAVSGMAGN
jgi:hypothetical protein